ncbi:unnamed protein product [Calicophoron daubneyi]|uniref:NAD dependent epimerase/dehydratase n=1 Tax=Calicophoron daubneyi TaxID=300641 RepID=A0AAV2T4X0_CALDB
MELRNREPLLVIGAGCGRTGTKSLKIALEMIYEKTCYHMTELIDNHRDHALKWIQVDKMVSESKDGRIDGSIFGEIFAGYVCTVDFPGCTYFKQLMDTYPDAKVILTVRDAKSWTESVRSTIMRKKVFLPQSWAQRLVAWYFVGRHFLEMESKFFRRTFGEDLGNADNEEVMRAFNSWNEKVRNTVPADQLLVFNVRDGWKPLCEFLSQPIPPHPFPHVNKREELELIFLGFDSMASLVGRLVPSLLFAFVGLIVYVNYGG